MSLISGVPVSAISSGRADARADPLGELQHVLRALRGLVLDEVRLVDDHPAEAEVAEPADVPVEHLVVDDDDVGEAVDRVAVAVDHGGRPVRRPEPGLARPVGLDDVGHDDEQRVGVRRPGRRAAPGRSCRGRARRRAGRCGARSAAAATTCAWCGISSQAARARARGPGSGSAMQAERPVAGVLEGAEQRPEQLPAGEPRGPRRGLLGGGEVGGEERVGQLAGDRPTAARRGARCASGSGGRLGRPAPPRARPRPRRPRACSRLSAGPRRRRRRPRRAASSSEVSRAAVLARIVATPSSRLSCSARWASVLVVSALTRARSSRTSSATTWNFVRTDGQHRRRAATALSTSRTARASTGMMPSLSRSRHAPLGARSGTASAGLALASSSHRLLLWSTRPRPATGDTRAQSRRRGDRTSSEAVGGRSAT